MAMTISKDLLGKIVDEVFDGCCEDTSAIEEIYRIVSVHLTQPAQAVDVTDAMVARARAAFIKELKRGRYCGETSDGEHDRAMKAALTRALSGEKAGPVGDVPPIKPVFPDDADIDRWRAIGWNECRNSMLDARGSASKAKFFLVQGVNSEDTPVLLFSSNWFAEQYCKQNPQPDGYYQIYAALPASPTPDKEG